MAKDKNELEAVIPVSLQRGETISINISEYIGLKSIDIVKSVKDGVLKIEKGIINYTPERKFKGTDFLIYSGSGDKGLEKRGMIVFSVGDIVFKPRARLLIQLGEKLIKNESIALTELVKNAYDADASYCKVQMNMVDNKNNGEIIIEDDGWGMDLSTIRNAWLEPGSDNKEKLVRDKIYSKKGRLPIGEKGIGRFGVHKLGREIELITRKQGEEEVVVKINWEDFEQHKYLDKAPVSVFERTPETFLGRKSGTKITIRKLTRDWSRGLLREAFRAINATSVPLTYDIDKVETLSKQKPDPNSFSALPATDKSLWIEDIPKWQDILQYALFFFDIEIENDQVKKFNYKFRPWENMKSVTGREVTEKQKPVEGICDIPDLSQRKYTPLQISKDVAIGSVKFQGCIYVRDKNILKIALDKPTFLSDYLNDNGGIRIYRNGLRIYDYGEKENDWLDLDYRRFNDPGVKISNNMILASITLQRETSYGLIEKTNREGFIDNDSYRIFKNQILYALKLIEICRTPDKKRLDEIIKPKVETESVLKSIDGLRSYIGEKIKDKKTKTDLEFYVDRVEKNYRFMYNTLVKTANAGMGWGIYIHEVEKIIKEIEKSVSRSNDNERSIKLVSHLAKLIESYSQILRKSSRTKEDIIKVIEQSLFNVDYRLKAHGISIITDFKQSKLDTEIKITRNLIVSTIMNVIDNSIYWLDRAGRKNKKLRIALSNGIEGFISIIISDNGTGFSLSPEEMTEPFMSTKPGGTGLGLHIAKEVMEGHSGNLSFNEYGEIELPAEFKKGATIILSFKI